jgi:lambda repressor-like predicted transcriptional regulator
MSSEVVNYNIIETGYKELQKKEKIFLKEYHEGHNITDSTRKAGIGYGMGRRILIDEGIIREQFHKIQKPKLSDEDIVECIRLKDAGKSLREISRGYPVCDRTIWNAIRKYQNKNGDIVSHWLVNKDGRIRGNNNRNGRWSILTLNQIRKADKEHINGDSYRVLSRKYQVSKNTLRTYISLLRNGELDQAITEFERIQKINEVIR